MRHVNTLGWEGFWSNCCEVNRIMVDRDPVAAGQRERFEAFAYYQELKAEFGSPYYTRIDAPATREQKERRRNCRRRR
jgi:phosphoglucomutase